MEDLPDQRVQSLNHVRVALLTTGGEYGSLVASRLRELAVPLEAIILDAHRPSLRQAVVRPRSIVGTARRAFAGRRLRRFGPVRTVGNVNTQPGIRALRAVGADLLVVAGARILSAEVLATARQGALNAHPARLPGFRGLDVVGWSILGGAPVEVTVHFVSPTVDAGDVLMRRLVPVAEADTFEEIEARAGRLAALALAETAARLVGGEEFRREPQAVESAALGRLSHEERERCRQLVAAGEAVRRYRERAGE